MGDQFVDLVGSKSIPADFVSLHTYGNQSTGTSLQTDLNNIQQEIATQHLATPVSITEWGPSSGSQLNFQPSAGAFALDFASTITQAGVSDAIFLALSQFPVDDWPVLYTTDQSPTDIMTAFEALAALNGTQGTCTSSGGLSCVAVTGGDGTVSLVFWNFGWTSTCFPDAMTPEIDTYKITIQLEGAAATAYAMQSAQLNSAQWDAAVYPIGLDSGGTSIGLTIKIPYGSYGRVSLKPD